MERKAISKAMAVKLGVKEYYNGMYCVNGSNRVKHVDKGCLCRACLLTFNNKEK